MRALLENQNAIHMSMADEGYGLKRLYNIIFYNHVKHTRFGQWVTVLHCKFFIPQPHLVCVSVRPCNFRFITYCCFGGIAWHFANILLVMQRWVITLNQGQKAIHGICLDFDLLLLQENFNETSFKWCVWAKCKTWRPWTWFRRNSTKLRTIDTYGLMAFHCLEPGHILKVEKMEVICLNQ